MKILMIGLLFTASIVYTSCNKDEKENEDNNGNNFASKLEGTYIGNADYFGAEPATTIITRINNNSVNLQLSGIGYTLCLDSVNVNTASTFNFNEYDGCFGENATGGGNLSGSTLNYTWTQVGGSAISITFSGSK